MLIVENPPPWAIGHELSEFLDCNYIRQGGHFQMFQLIVHSSLQTAEETRHEALLATLEVQELVGGSKCG